MVLFKLLNVLCKGSRTQRVLHEVQTNNAIICTTRMKSITNYIVPKIQFGKL